MIIRPALLLSAMLHSLGAQAADSQEDTAKILRLETTVEELTIQLADTIAERNRLREALSDAIAAQSAEQKVVIGCDVDDAKRYASYSSNKEASLADWLKRDGNASKCTASQLQSLQAFFEPNPYLEAGQIVKYELSTR